MKKDSSEPVGRGRPHLCSSVSSPSSLCPSRCRVVERLDGGPRPASAASWRWRRRRLAGWLGRAGVKGRIGDLKTTSVGTSTVGSAKRHFGLMPRCRSVATGFLRPAVTPHRGEPDAMLAGHGVDRRDCQRAVPVRHGLGPLGEDKPLVVGGCALGHERSWTV